MHATAFPPMSSNASPADRDRLDRRMVAKHRRDARRSRRGGDRDDVAELLVAVFGSRLAPDDVLRRARRQAS